VATTKKSPYEMRLAYATERRAQLLEPNLIQSRPYWKYLHNETQATPCHVEWSGLVLRYDDPWWDTHFPPNGPDCRCRGTAVRPEEYTGQAAPRDE
jgi:hypothetical protein